MAFTGDDVALVHALREGRAAAKAALFERHARSIERIITHVIGFDRELADIVQEVFVSALASIHTLQDPSALPAWLARVAALTARKVLRTRSRRAWLRLFSSSEEEAHWELPVAGSDHDVLRAVRTVYAVLEKLPVDERIAFSLRYMEDMDVAEVAVACDVSLSTVKRRLRRAERRFVTEARRRPELEIWLKEGSRWEER
jgi:RNA polymerase sigma-70 factor (ECF subfamily)